MVDYTRLWQLMKEKNITTYGLMKHYGISNTTVQRIRTGKHVTTRTLEDFCRILNCRVEDLIEIIPDDNNIVTSSQPG